MILLHLRGYLYQIFLIMLSDKLTINNLINPGPFYILDTPSGGSYRSNFKTSKKLINNVMWFILLSTTRLEGVIEIMNKNNIATELGIIVEARPKGMSVQTHSCLRLL